jgi:alginate O-acetyltransferase complex protein AlgI
MLFNSAVFLFFFLPAVLVVYAVLYRFGGARSVLGFLVLASLVFYGWWNPIYLPLLGGLAVFNFGLARWITTERERQRFSLVHALLTLGVVGDLLVLGYFKYADFFIGTADTIFGNWMPLQRIVLPLGISFFTFQKIAYLVDSSRGQVERHDFLEYCFFVMFFPQLIAGPIVRHDEIFTQVQRRQAFSPHLRHLAIGLTIFLIGLFKKFVADRVAPYASDVFEAAAAGHPLGMLYAWQGAVAYSLQLYFDFSGYSDMAIGLARLFGIRLPINFDSPYQSLNIIEFWQRWHMTLSRFLRDYLYIPFGGNRRGTARRYINLMLTMTIGGLWHGAAWTFVIWGFLHGAYLVVNHGWRLVWVSIDRWWSRAVARLVTLIAVIVAFVIFRAPDLAAALRIYAGMAGMPQADIGLAAPATSIARLGGGVAVNPGALTPTQAAIWGALALAALWLLPNTQQIMARFGPAFGYDLATPRLHVPLLAGVRTVDGLIHWRPTALGAAVTGVLAALAFLSLQHVSEFLYFEF